MGIEQDEFFMRRALAMAEMAAALDEVPVGAVLVKGSNIVAEGYNNPIHSNDPTAHAEIIALRRGGEKLGNYRLLDTSLYVTLEPCAMCAGAIIHARVARLVFAARDPKTGACGSVMNMLGLEKGRRRIEIQEGILAQDSIALLQKFFLAKRKTDQHGV